MAIAEAFGAPFPADYDEFNQFVFLVLCTHCGRRFATWT
jgi:hypothetical protein